MVELERKIRQYMSEYRFNHTLSVVNECKALAKTFDIKDDDLIIAAYLHDITKEMTVNEQLEICGKMGITLDGCTLLSPKTLHAYSAPALIERDFPQYARDGIITPIRYHTTGRADMSLCEKLLYLADYIEPTRRFDDCKALRNYFYANTCDIQKRLDDTITLSLKYTISDLLDKGEYIHLETIRAYNALTKKTGD